MSGGYESTFGLPFASTSGALRTFDEGIKVSSEKLTGATVVDRGRTPMISLVAVNQ